MKTHDPRHEIARRHWLAFSAAAATGFAIAPAPVWAQEKRPRFAREIAKLWVREETPFNAEARLPDLMSKMATPLEHFFLRSNGDTPEIDPETYRLKIEGLVGRPAELSLADLKKLKSINVPATLQCAGNRRAEFAAEKKAAGLQWGAGAIASTLWQGYPLAEVLKSVEPKADAKHVWFDGLDTVTHKDGSKTNFAGSIPLARALDPKAQVLLADRMLGAPLTIDHGFPLRVVAPGVIGARSVKWLGKITLADKPSPNPFVATSYKLTPSESKADSEAADPIYELVVNSVICSPADGDKSDKDTITLYGYALPSGAIAAKVEKVVVLNDTGEEFPTTFEFDAKPAMWVHWQAKVPLMPGKNAFRVKATDSTGAVQPDKAKWNARGYLYNAPHQVTIERV